MSTIQKKFFNQKKIKLISKDSTFKWIKYLNSKSLATIKGHYNLIKQLSEYIYEEDSRHELLPFFYGKKTTKRKSYHIYKSQEVLSILKATHSLPPFMSNTYYTLIGLLASTGMRIGELLALDIDDIDLINCIIRIKKDKKKRERRVLIDPTVAKKLRKYQKICNALFDRKKCSSFFLSTTGTRPLRQNVFFCFKRLLKKVNLNAIVPRPRIHDFRHTFIINTLIRFYDEGKNVESKLYYLSTYVGHASPSSTYWYLSSTPELMSCATRLLAKKVRGNL